MDKEYLKEKINHNRNIKDNIWTALIVTIGGTIGLSLNSNSILKIILICVGVLAIIFFINAYFIRFSIIENLISKLKQGE